MFKNRRWLGVGLVTLVIVGAAIVLSLPVADAGKPAPPPLLPKYTIKLMPICPGNVQIDGMNNRGQILASGES